MIRSRTLLFILLFTAGIPASFLHADGEEAVRFSEHRFVTTYYGDGSTGTEPEYDGRPYLHISLSCLEPVSLGNAPAPKHLRQFCGEFYFGDGETFRNEDTIQSEFKDIAAATLTDWEENGLSVLEDFPDAVSTAMWEFESAMTVDYNAKGLLSFGSHFYQYAGGAHGISNSVYAVYDLKTGRNVTLDMLFIGDWYGPVTYMITEEAKRRFELDKFSSLTAAGFFVDELEPTGNFYLTDEGITFVYSVYEVAPYVMGGIDITVSYEDLGVLLAPDGAAARISGP
jgi:hypothetical protein